MIQMLSNIFSAIATLFGAAERGANALDSMAKWAEEEAANFERTESLRRAALLKEIMLEYQD